MRRLRVLVLVASVAAVWVQGRWRSHARRVPRRLWQLPDSVRQVLHDVLEADRKPDGQLRQDNIFRYILASKP